MSECFWQFVVAVGLWHWTLLFLRSYPFHQPLFFITHKNIHIFLSYHVVLHLCFTSLAANQALSSYISQWVPSSVLLLLLFVYQSILQLLLDSSFYFFFINPNFMVIFALKIADDSVTVDMGDYEYDDDSWVPCNCCLLHCLTMYLVFNGCVLFFKWNGLMLKSFLLSLTLPLVFSAKETEHAKEKKIFLVLLLFFFCCWFWNFTLVFFVAMRFTWSSLIPGLATEFERNEKEFSLFEFLNSQV